MDGIEDVRCGVNGASRQGIEGIPNYGWRRDGSHHAV